MKIILAGYNIDAEVIRAFQEAHPEAPDITPETIAAAYARISRSPLAVNELRAAARREVERARQSNRTIVFEMGHSSIAEHAVFNIDVLGVSRLLVEEIEKFRLCSYTEKSQRYVLLTDDFVVPEEIRHKVIAERFIAIIREQNRFYHELYGRLRAHVLDTQREMASDPAHRSTLDGWAKEDARYCISLATETQLGMTINARNLELMIRRLAANPLAEAQHCGRMLYETTKDIAPSLVRYTEATDYDRLTRSALRQETAGLIAKKQNESDRNGANSDSEPVRLISATPGADERILASLLHSSADITFSQCLDMASRMNTEEKEGIVKTALRHLKAHDPVLREFENVDFLYELCISATCFAQLKRHRMATITCQDYNPALGATVPPAVREIGMEGPFGEIIARTEDMYAEIADVAPPAAAYILTNAHRKRVLMKINARELYHIARLRLDSHAQWDIRETAGLMLAAAKGVMPLTLMMAAGKDAFPALHGKLVRGQL